jgi:hypothetical protein
MKKVYTFDEKGIYVLHNKKTELKRYVQEALIRAFILIFVSQGAIILMNFESIKVY